MKAFLKRTILALNFIAFFNPSLSLGVEYPQICPSVFDSENEESKPINENEAIMSAEVEFRESILNSFMGRGKNLTIASSTIEAQKDLLSTDENHLTGRVLNLKDSIHRVLRNVQNDLLALKVPISDIKLGSSNIQKGRKIGKNLSDLENSFQELELLVSEIQRENERLGEAYPQLMGLRVDLRKYIDYLEKSVRSLSSSNASQNRIRSLSTLIKNEKSNSVLKMNEIDSVIGILEQRQIRNTLVLNQTSLLVEVDYPRFLRATQLTLADKTDFNLKLASYRFNSKKYVIPSIIMLLLGTGSIGAFWEVRNEKILEAEIAASQKVEADIAARAKLNADKIAFEALQKQEKETAALVKKKDNELKRFLNETNDFLKTMKEKYQVNEAGLNYLSDPKISSLIKISQTRNYIGTRKFINPGELALFVRFLPTDTIEESITEKKFYNSVKEDVVGEFYEKSIASYAAALVKAIQKTDFKKVDAIELQNIISALENKEVFLVPDAQFMLAEDDKKFLNQLILRSFERRNIPQSLKDANIHVIPKNVNNNQVLAQILVAKSSPEVKRWALLAAIDTADSISINDFKRIVSTYSKSTELAVELKDRFKLELEKVTHNDAYVPSDSFYNESLLMFMIAVNKVNLNTASVRQLDELISFSNNMIDISKLQDWTGVAIKEDVKNVLLQRFYDYKRANTIIKSN